MLNRLWHSNELLISDKEETGSEAITSKLETVEENKDKVTYFLIVGVDKSSKLTDCIWLMCFDREGSKMNVLQVPRDTYVGSDSKSKKINGVYGSPKTVTWCEECGYSPDSGEISNSKHSVCGKKLTKKKESNINALIRCLNTRLSLPVDHFVIFDFEGFRKVVDALGGVDLTLDKAMTLKPYKITLKAGENHLNGKAALAFMRHRKSYAEGDLGRVKAQRKLINALMEKVTSMDTADMLSVVSASVGNFSTDLSLSQLKQYAVSAKKMSTENLHMFELPGKAHWVKPNPSYYACNESKALLKINEYMLPYSQKLTAGDVDFPEIVDSLTTKSTEASTKKTTESTAEKTTKATKATTESTTEKTTESTTEKTNTTEPQPEPGEDEE